jgi:hypothetical protein
MRDHGRVVPDITGVEYLFMIASIIGIAPNHQKSSLLDYPCFIFDLMEVHATFGALTIE